MAQDFNYQSASVAEHRAEVDHDSGAAIAGTMASTPHSELKRFRISKRESQEKFWGRFGVTQSSGSRFETGLGIPAPVAILVKLYVKGKLSDGDLPG
ncbi:helix-turn-helix domain-containing protein [Massilia atriviolacea]|uniref:helix-turn-helix domain-containing protein n=1 Tax=Massilia atriviolacea TaxID=2495579 RepID=UPI001E4BAEE8|nr:helix-turn-helix transcriptional regulator [Massilia atriviolacea]